MELGKDKIKEYKLNKHIKCVIINLDINNEHNILDIVAGYLKNNISLIVLKSKLTTEKTILIGKRIRELTAMFDADFLIHDRADIVILTEADGIYLTNESMSINNAKYLLNNEKMLAVEDTMPEFEKNLKEIDFLIVNQVKNILNKPMFLLEKKEQSSGISGNIANRISF